MAETLTFAKLHVYDTREFGIQLPVRLTAGEKSLGLQAKLDTGSGLCVFPRRYGEELGFDIESGMYQRISTATGGFDAYGHWATLLALGCEYEAMIYFAKDHSFNRNILGRQGWLDRIRMGLVDYEGKLFVSDYNDPAK
jgi:hypothetical protein